MPSEELGKHAFKHTISKDAPLDNITSVTEEVLQECRESLSQVLSPFRSPADIVIKETREMQELDEMEEEDREFYNININSVVCPLPICSGHEGRPSGIHNIFNALTDKRCKLEKFTLDNFIFHRHAEYFSCLGGALRENNTLRTLRIENSLPEGNKVNEYKF